MGTSRLSGFAGSLEEYENIFFRSAEKEIITKVDSYWNLVYLAKQNEYAQNLPMIQQMVNSFQIGNSGNGATAGSVGGGPVQNVANGSPRQG